MKKVGLTGAEGNIGLTLREGLAKEYNITSFTLFSEAFPSIVGNIAIPSVLKGKFSGLETVIHLAANPSPEAPWEKVLVNNIIATKNVFDEALSSKVKRVVFASTNHVQHGHTMKTTPETLDASTEKIITLENPTLPDSLYAVSKVFGEELGKYCARIHGLEVICLRIGWTFQENNPAMKKGTPSEEYMRAMFLSKSDCVGYFRRAIEIELTGKSTQTPNFLLAYALSNNGKRVFCLDETISLLGYNPLDDAEDYFNALEKAE